MGEIITREEINSYIKVLKMEKDNEIRIAPEISMKEIKKPSPTNTITSKPTGNSSLESKLKDYRMEQAKKYDISPGFVFSNKELEDILTKRPSTARAVANLPGFGPKKKERHSEDIAKLVRESV